MRNLRLILFLSLSLILISACSSQPGLDNPIGFGQSLKADVNFWAKELNAQWYYNWGTKNTRPDKNLEFWQMIRVNQDGYSPSKEDILDIIRKHKGYTWIIGNEPDNISQDNVTPEKYAEIYHDLYYLIKTKDRTAKIAIAGVSQPTPSRLTYLDVVLDTYELLYNEKLPVDWWNIHGYVLNEEADSWGAGLPVGIESLDGILYDIDDHGDLDIFHKNLINFRIWMKENGYQNKPLVLTEFGILLPEDFGFTSTFVANYLTQATAWLMSYEDEDLGYPEDGFKLVQKFAWFSLSDPYFPVSDLADLQSNSLTDVGKAFSRIQEQNISEND
jgi:hypothetical protein